MTVTPPARLRDYLSTPEFQAGLRSIISKEVTPERLVRIAVQALSRNPKLQECTTLSLAQAITEAAELGLEPGTSVLGHAWLVPFWNKRTNQMEAQLMVSYKGKAELARRSGLVQRIEAREYREHDVFLPRGGTEPKLVHTWDTTKDRGPVRGYYAVAFYNDGSTQFADMTVAEVEDHRQRYSKDPDSPAWRNAFDEMGKKTVVHRLEKMLPLSPEQQKAHDLDDENAEILQGRVVPEAPLEAATPTTEQQGPAKSKALKRAQAQVEMNLPTREREKVPAGGEASRPAEIPPAAAPTPEGDPGPCTRAEGCVRPEGHAGDCDVAAEEVRP